MAQFILEEGTTEYFCSANISFVIAGPTGAGKMAGLGQIVTNPTTTQPQHNHNTTTTQPQHNLNTVVGLGLGMKMTLHTTHPTTSPPQKLNGSLQEPFIEPHINIY